MTGSLLRLYPRAWRERYGDEFAELLEARPPSLRDQLDIVLGAIDARMNPQLPGHRPARTASMRDRLLAIGAITAGVLFSLWAAVIVAALPRWGEAGAVDEGLLNLSFGAGMLGAMLGIAVLLGLALRHIRDLHAIGAIGAVLAAAGFLMFTGESGTEAVLLLFSGTLLMSVGLARAVGWVASLVLVVATVFVAAAMFGFVGGNGQELLWMWMLVVYGPSWMLLGLNLRKGVRSTAWTPSPA
jgi:hypothetical protein